MTVVRYGIDFLLAAIAALAWSFAGFALGSRFVSHTAGDLIGIGLLFSTSAMLLTTYLRDQRLASLADGRCPRCRSRVGVEHRHRRWEPDRGEWVAPATSWECTGCLYSHAESWPCPGCPE